MLFLSPQEKRQWAGLGDAVLAGRTSDTHAFDGEIRSNVRPVFDCFVGALLAARGQEQRAVACGCDSIRHYSPPVKLATPLTDAFLARAKRWGREKKTTCSARRKS